MAGVEGRREREGSNSFKIKMITFIDRRVPIMLHNDRKSCPLLAICNVLLLRNELKLNMDSEVSQQQLLHLLGEQMLDANRNVANKDAVCEKNKLQNINDMIELIPSLTTELNVDVSFRNIRDFQFTPACAIFDLLDVDLVHGWVTDPRDIDTIAILGSNSFNTLKEKLAALGASSIEHDIDCEVDSVDFAAATTATLGVPCPSVSRIRSFGIPPPAVSLHQTSSQEDIQEAELVNVLDLSKADLSNPINESVTHDADAPLPMDISGDILSSGDVGIPELSEEHKCDKCHIPFQPEGIEDECIKFTALDDIGSSAESTLYKNSISVFDENENGIKTPERPFAGCAMPGSLEEDNKTIATHEVEEFCFPNGSDVSLPSNTRESRTSSLESEELLHGGPKDSLTSFMKACKSNDSSILSLVGTNSEISFNDGECGTVVPMDSTSSLDGSEPIYEGEDFVQDLGVETHSNWEPMYEGEVVLANQADRERGGGFENQPSHEDAQYQCHEPMAVALREGDFIRNFLANSASQLTAYGLFCLQEQLEEHSLCVFVRNNHFSTMFKHEGQLYLLAADPSYINHPDLVWEKLNKIDGDPVFTTGNFEEFRAEDETINSWDEQKPSGTLCRNL